MGASVLYQGPQPTSQKQSCLMLGPGLGLCTPCQLADCRLWVHLPTCFLKGRGWEGDSASSRHSVSLFSLIHPPSPCLGGLPCWSQGFTWRLTKIFIFRGLHSLPRLWLLYSAISHVPWTEYLCPP